jgi:hypothetical protein
MATKRKKKVICDSFKGFWEVGGMAQVDMFQGKDV